MGIHGTACWSFIDFQKAYDSGEKYCRTFLLKLVRIFKMCLNETCSKVHIGKHVSDAFPVQNSLK